MNEPFWKPIPTPVPLPLASQRMLVGGWWTRGDWRVGLCTWDDAAQGFVSERGGVATHYLTVIPIAPVRPAGGLGGPVAVEASPDPALTDWDGDPAGPPVL